MQVKIIAPMGRAGYLEIATFRPNSGPIVVRDRFSAVVKLGCHSTPPLAIARRMIPAGFSFGLAPCDDPAIDVAAVAPFHIAQRPLEIPCDGDPKVIVQQG